MINRKIVVVIPIYKKEIDKDERKSFNQCLNVLSNFPIVIVAPKTLDLSEYILPDNIDIIRFKDVFFNNINGYNQLMLSSKFYKSFSNYTYILIYQLDAYVFNDDLANWCSKDYDYIGAPWRDVLVDYQRGRIDFGVGNGGLSLRKVSSFIKVLKSWHRIYDFEFLIKRAIKDVTGLYSVIAFIKTMYFYLFKNNYNYRFNGYDRNEDYFWGVVVPEKTSWFKIPNIDEASNFSIDENPDYFITFVKNKTPMGCHAWPKNHDAFWKDYIK